MIKDPFLNDNLAVEKLVNQWLKSGILIIAYDFDDTIYDYTEQKYTYPKVISLLQECAEIGAFFIVYTARNTSDEPFIKDYLIKNNIPFDTFGESPEFIRFNGKKVYYNILLDDKAGLSASYKILKKASKLVKTYKKLNNKNKGEKVK
jgi:hydroxymethylpyrimidine pyrophosphatase-like HAD family hydrolase